MKHPTTPHEAHVKRMVAFHQAAFDQYRERTGMTYRDATNELLRVHREEGEAASTALVDAVVDAELRSTVWQAERMAFLRQHYPEIARKVEVNVEPTGQTSLFQS